MTRWAEIEDDFLICRVCGFKEWTREYCPVCVNNMLMTMQMFADYWDISESGRKRLYEQIVAEKLTSGTQSRCKQDTSNLQKP